MSAAVVGVVEGVNVAGAEGVALGADQALDAFAHGTEVDGNVGGVGDELPVGVEDGAGEVETLFDVDGGAGVLQGDAHFFRDRPEEVVEDFEADGVGSGGLGGWGVRGLGGCSGWGRWSG